VHWEEHVGSFIGAHVIAGVRYEVFACNGDGSSYTFDVYDPEGNLINEATVLDHPPTDIEIAKLAEDWRNRRMALIVPTGDCWRFLWAGDKVILKLATFWWPW
jgi:hypothetical protein